MGRIPIIRRSISSPHTLCTDYPRNSINNSSGFVMLPRTPNLSRQLSLCEVGVRCRREPRPTLAINLGSLLVRRKGARGFRALHRQTCRLPRGKQCIPWLLCQRNR